MHHAFKLGETEHNLELARTTQGYWLYLKDRKLKVYLDGWEPGKATRGTCTILVEGKQSLVTIATRGDDVFVHADGEVYELHYEHPLERLAHQAGGASDDAIKAPMPGSLVALNVKPGQAVKRGETLLVMESMKMETTIPAPRDGTVHAVNYAPGQTFDRDAVLLTLEAAK